ncbi:MAG TPA: phosphotransferase [Candidatus Dormibacteraeota bacterium]|nr:phosphotransferase [Candidatus Dormibacteraeota bacterium]
MTAEDRLHAVLIEPQLARFRELCGVGGVALTASFDGWHRHAIMAPDRVYLFPRHGSDVPALLREATVLEALAGRGVPAPRLLGRWRDRAVSPYPFIAVSRCRGQTWHQLETAATLDAVAAMLQSLGGAIASWHLLDRNRLPRRFRRRRDDIDDMLDADELRAAATGTAHVLGLPRRQAADWCRELEPLMAMEPVIVHGDINEGQIVVDDTLAVTCILDWERAHIGHPLKDFDFGEWGYGIFAWEPHFGLFRRRMWEAYVAVRGGTLPSWRAMHLAFCLAWAYGHSRRTQPNDWARTRLANNLELLKQLAG